MARCGSHDSADKFAEAKFLRSVRRVAKGRSFPPKSVIVASIELVDVVFLQPVTLHVGSVLFCWLKMSAGRVSATAAEASKLVHSVCEVS